MCGATELSELSELAETELWLTLLGLADEGELTDEMLDGELGLADDGELSDEGLLWLLCDDPPEDLELTSDTLDREDGEL